MIGKIVDEQTWISIHNAIMLGEGIPKQLENGYKMLSYLGNISDYKHQTLDSYFIPKNNVTMKYCDGFEELPSDWFEQEILE